MYSGPLKWLCLYYVETFECIEEVDHIQSAQNDTIYIPVSALVLDPNSKGIVFFNISSFPKKIKLKMLILLFLVSTNFFSAQIRL